MAALVQLLFVLTMLLVAYITGKWVENRHYKSIKHRENNLLAQPAVTIRTLGMDKTIQSSELVVGSVVVSVDYFKRFLATLRNLFGGEITAYSSLIDRGRREAILRMKESCPKADIFINMRLETSTISSGREKSVGCVEIIAYGTALTYQK